MQPVQNSLLIVLVFVIFTSVLFWLYRLALSRPRSQRCRRAAVGLLVSAICSLFALTISVLIVSWNIVTSVWLRGSHGFAIGLGVILFPIPLLGIVFFLLDLLKPAE